MNSTWYKSFGIIYVCVDVLFCLGDMSTFISYTDNWYFTLLINCMVFHLNSWLKNSDTVYITHWTENKKAKFQQSPCMCCCYLNRVAMYPPYKSGHTYVVFKPGASQPAASTRPVSLNHFCAGHQYVFVLCVRPWGHK